MGYRPLNRGDRGQGNPERLAGVLRRVDVHLLRLAGLVCFVLITGVPDRTPSRSN
jgi:hypothetical protein